MLDGFDDVFKALVCYPLRKYYQHELLSSDVFERSSVIHSLQACYCGLEFKHKILLKIMGKEDSSNEYGVAVYDYFCRFLCPLKIESSKPQRLRLAFFVPIFRVPTQTPPSLPSCSFSSRYLGRCRVLRYRLLNSQSRSFGLPQK